MPVQHYSSGMKVRLGFAVAAQMEPDVLIIDEVLAVGDAKFKAKCFNVLEKLMTKCAVIIVSHSMPQIARICTDLILLEEGRIAVHENNNLNPALEKYYGLVGQAKESQIGNGAVRISGFEINGSSRQEYSLEYGKQVSFKIKLNQFDYKGEVSMRITFFDVEQKPVAQISSKNDGVSIEIQENSEIDVSIKNLSLNTGSYSIHVAVHRINQNEKEGEILHLIRSITTVNIIGNKYYSHAPWLINGNWFK